MIKRIIILVVMLLALQGMAQSPPKWVHNLPSPSNDSYLYMRGSGEGQTEREARNWAYAEVLRQAASNIGIRYDSEEIFSALQSEKDYKTISSTYNIAIRQVCEYIDEKATCIKVLILCQVAKSGAIRPLFDDFNACYEGVYEPLYANGFSVFRNGKELYDDELRTIFANSKSYRCYDAACRCKDASQSNAGLLGFGITGGLIMIVGGVVVGTSDYKFNNVNSDKVSREFRVGMGILGTGTALYITGLCWKLMMRLVGKSKIRKSVNLYNNGRMYSQSNLEMEYGLTGNGVYLTFRF